MTAIGGSGDSFSKVNALSQAGLKATEITGKTTIGKIANMWLSRLQGNVCFKENNTYYTVSKNDIQKYKSAHSLSFILPRSVVKNAVQEGKKIIEQGQELRRFSSQEKNVSYTGDNTVLLDSSRSSFRTSPILPKNTGGIQESNLSDQLQEKKLRIKLASESLLALLAVSSEHAKEKNLKNARNFFNDMFGGKAPEQFIKRWNPEKSGAVQSELVVQAGEAAFNSGDVHSLSGDEEFSTHVPLDSKLEIKSEMKAVEEFDFSKLGDENSNESLGNVGMKKLMELAKQRKVKNKELQTKIAENTSESKTKSTTTHTLPSLDFGDDEKISLKKTEEKASPQKQIEGGALEKIGNQTAETVLKMPKEEVLQVFREIKLNLTEKELSQLAQVSKQNNALENEFIFGWKDFYKIAGAEKTLKALTAAVGNEEKAKQIMLSQGIKQIQSK